MIDNLYREEILEHYQDPQNFGKLKNFDVTSHQLNPFCGDDITIYVSYHTDILSQISFTGTGCAISIAAASMLTQYAQGKTKQQLTVMTEADMLELLNVEVSETRKKCALLAFAVLKDCIS
jgi:nitrogen fixation protein NifU and related proteins